MAASQVRCPDVYNTKAEGGALLGVGILAAIGGAALIAVEEKRFHSPVRASLDVAPTGVSFALAGAF